MFGKDGGSRCTGILASCTEALWNLTVLGRYKLVVLWNWTDLALDAGVLMDILGTKDMALVDMEGQSRSMNEGRNE